MGRLSDTELDALDYLADGQRSSAATCHIERRTKQENAATRRMLQRLARRGLVEGVPGDMSGRVYWWRITEAGQAALAEAGDDPASEG